MTGNFAHFMKYAPAGELEARDYGVSRYGMELQRLCSVLDRHLVGKTYIVGEEYTIADVVVYPWIHAIRNGYKHPSGVDADGFLTFSQYANVIAWADRILARPAVARGVTVCIMGVGKPWLELPTPPGPA